MSETKPESRYLCIGPKHSQIRNGLASRELLAEWTGYTLQLPTLDQDQNLTLGDEKMANTVAQPDTGIAPPKQGDTFRCDGCGMELKVTKDCGCKESEHVHFHCCGKEMIKI